MGKVYAALAGGPFNEDLAVTVPGQVWDVQQGDVVQGSEGRHSCIHRQASWRFWERSGSNEGNYEKGEFVEYNMEFQCVGVAEGRLGLGDTIPLFPELAQVQTSRGRAQPTAAVVRETLTAQGISHAERKRGRRGRKK